MNSPANAHRRYSAADLAAAEWAILHDSGLDPEQQQRFEEWLKADPGHARAFADLDETWSALDQLAELRPSIEAGDLDALAPARLHRSAARQRSKWPMAMAAAAAVIFAVIGGWQFFASERFIQVTSTEVGGHRKLELPDGSVVLLNTASAVEVRYSTAARRVNLTHGEAHFTVEKNPKKPFIVNVRGVDIQAVGTAFNVRLRPETVEVLVTEGRVRVSDSAKGGTLLVENAVPPAAAAKPRKETAAETSILAAGELAVISLASESMRVPIIPVAIPPLQMQRTLAWQERRLEFAAVPLAEMVAEFNRYNRHKLVIGDRRLAGQHFGGNFRSDGYEVLVHLLETNYGVIAERTANTTVLRLPP